MFIFPYKCIGTQIWPCCKKIKYQPRFIIWTNLVDFESPMLYTTIQSQSFLGSWKEDFSVFLPYMGMAAILLIGRLLFDRSLHMKMKF